MKSYLLAMKNYVNFDGRATRSQFWLYILMYFVLLSLAIFLDALFNLPITNRGYGILEAVFLLGHMLPNLSIQVRRLRDIDKSGWWVLLWLVPVAGWITLIVFNCLPSKAEGNRFSPPMNGAISTAPTTALVPAVDLSSSNTVERLEKLAALKASGALDDTEFQKLKSDIMNSSK